MCRRIAKQISKTFPTATLEHAEVGIGAYRRAKDNVSDGYEETWLKFSEIVRKAISVRHRRCID